mgnify:FL=1
MAYLVRKITPPKWIQELHEISCAEDINAETFSDLCADENAISTWYVGNKTDTEIKQAVLALASGFRSLDEIKIVFLDDEEIKRAGLNIEATIGNTKISEYATLHRDIVQLNAGKLLILANLILKQVGNEQTKTINAEELTLWMLQVMKEGKLKFDDLDKNFRSGFAGKVKKLINKKKINLQEFPSDIQDDLQKQWNQNKRRTNCKYELICPKYGHAS